MPQPSQLLPPTAGNYLLEVVKGVVQPTPLGTGLAMTADGTLNSSGGAGATVSSTAFGSEPGSPTTGDLDFYSNSYGIARYSGAAWPPWGPIFPLTLPDDSVFSWVNQGGATVSTTNGGIFLLAPATAGTNLRIRVQSVTAPYTITAIFLPRMPGVDFTHCGLVFRESGSGKLATFTALHDQSGQNGWTLKSEKFNSATSFNATYTTLTTHTLNCPLMLQISDNSTNRICRWSTDGQHWLQIHSVGDTDFLTANQAGFSVNADQNTWDAAVTLISYLKV